MRDLESDAGLVERRDLVGCGICRGMRDLAGCGIDREAGFGVNAGFGGRDAGFIEGCAIWRDARFGRRRDLA